MAILATSSPLCAQQDPFRWMDFHSDKDRDIVVWVMRSLAVEKWTAIREIGVQYDAALVVTTERPSPQSSTSNDTFTVWSLSLTSHDLTPLIKGVNLRLLDWLLLADGEPRELGALYEDCNQCSSETYFTAFHYDFAHHMWAARWMRGSLTAPIWSSNLSQGVGLTQVYALLNEPNGRQLMGTWNHIDHGNEKPEDSLYRYDLDPVNGMERTQLLSGKEAEAMKQRLCAAQNASSGLERGQDSPLCQQFVKAVYRRKPVTTPPANNHGQSMPPGVRH
ncbi:MAG TPA: hypothetical protein VGF01_00775 [Terracidiphilus sp.]